MKSEVDLFLEAIPNMRDAGKGEPASGEDIAAVEDRYRIKLPVDVREYFLKINGSYEGGWFIEIGSLNEWCSLPEYVERWGANYGIEATEKYYWFGHYDISVWEWVIALSDDPDAKTPVYVLYHGITKVADSFSDFLRIYREHGAESLMGFG